MNIDASLLLLFGFGSVTISIALFFAGAHYETKRNVIRVHRGADALQSAIVHSQPSFAQIQDLATFASLNAGEAILAIRLLRRRVLTGKDSTLEPHKELLELYLAEWSKIEPFEGLSGDTRRNLERLVDALPDKRHLVEPLAAQLRELISAHEQSKGRQRLYTVGGFFIGLASAVFALYAYYYPYVK